MDSVALKYNFHGKGRKINKKSAFGDLRIWDMISGTNIIQISILLYNF